MVIVSRTTDETVTERDLRDKSYRVIDTFVIVDKLTCKNINRISDSVVFHEHLETENHNDYTSTHTYIHSYTEARTFIHNT